MDKFEKIAQLMKDEAFVEELLENVEVSDVQKFMAEKGVELTEEEVIEWGNVNKQVLDSGELDEGALENVAGGALVPWRFIPLPLPRPIPWWPRTW